MNEENGYAAIVGLYIMTHETVKMNKHKAILIEAHKRAMAGLKAAEDARAKAVEEEAKLGIDYSKEEDN